MEGGCPWRKRGERRASQAWPGQRGAHIVEPSSRHTGGTAPPGRSPVACKTDTSNAQNKEGSMRVTGMGRGSEHETRGSTVLDKWQPSSFVLAFSAGIWGSCQSERCSTGNAPRSEPDTLLHTGLIILDAGCMGVWPLCVHVGEAPDSAAAQGRLSPDSKPQASMVTVQLQVERVPVPALHWHCTAQRSALLPSPPLLSECNAPSPSPTEGRLPPTALRDRNASAVYF